jgi:hypothetical protein
MFIAQEINGHGYLAYQDRNVYCYNEASYARFRDVIRRGVDRSYKALSNKDCAISAHLDAEGMYRYQLELKSGLILRSARQYSSIKAAERAALAFHPHKKVKKITW